MLLEVKGEAAADLDAPFKSVAGRNGALSGILSILIDRTQLSGTFVTALPSTKVR